MSQAEYGTGVFIGRFQPFHAGHRRTVESALQRCNEVVLVIGSARSARSTRNPFTADERCQMISREFGPELMTRIRFELVRDYFYNTNAWVGEVREKVTSGSRGGAIGLFGVNKDATTSYLSWFPDWIRAEQLLTTHGPIINATDLRESFFRNPMSVAEAVKSGTLGEGTAKWLADYSKTESYLTLAAEQKALDQYRKEWSTAPYPPVFVTTDAVVIQAGHIVMIQRKKSPGKGLWALPGGFLDPNESLETCAIRELHEETQIALDAAELRKSIAMVRTFDHPLRSTRGRTITHAHVFKLPGTQVAKITASDDAAAAKWIPLLDVAKMEEQCFEDHFHIIRAVLS